jgi:hypothetical protein
MDYTNAIRMAPSGARVVSAVSSSGPQVRPLNNLLNSHAKNELLRKHIEVLTGKIDRRNQYIHDIRTLLPFVAAHTLRVTSAVTSLVEGKTAGEVPVFSNPFESVDDISGEITVTLRCMCRLMDNLEKYLISTLAMQRDDVIVGPAVLPNVVAVAPHEVSEEAEQYILHSLKELSIIPPDDSVKTSCTAIAPAPVESDTVEKEHV